MEKNVLKSAFFGFSKTSVCEYIADMNIEFNEKVNELNQEHSAELDEWRQKAYDLEKELAGLNNIRASLEKSEEEIRSLREENEKLKEDSFEKDAVIEEKEDLVSDLNAKTEKLKEENKSLSDRILEKEEAVKAVLEEKELLYEKLSSIPDDKNSELLSDDEQGEEILEEKMDISNIISDSNILRLYKYKNYITELQNDLNSFISITNRDINKFFGEFDVKLNDFKSGSYLKEDK